MSTKYPLIATLATNGQQARKLILLELHCGPFWFDWSPALVWREIKGHLCVWLLLVYVDKDFFFVLWMPNIRTKRLLLLGDQGRQVAGTLEWVGRRQEKERLMDIWTGKNERERITFIFLPIFFSYSMQGIHAVSHLLTSVTSINSEFAELSLISYTWYPDFLDLTYPLKWYHPYCYCFLWHFFICISSCLNTTDRRRNFVPIEGPHPT